MNKIIKLMQEQSTTTDPYKREVLRFQLEQVKTQFEELQHIIDDLCDQCESESEGGQDWREEYNKLQLETKKDRKFISDFGPYIALYSLFDCMVSE